MMGNYFVVLQLSEDDKRRFENGKSDPVDLTVVARQIKMKKVKLLCSRCDTGIAEAFRLQAQTARSFATCLLLTVPLEDYEVFDEEAILDKAAFLAGHAHGTQLIDRNDKFQLIAAA